MTSLKNWVALSLIIASSALAHVMKPTHLLAETRGDFDLEKVIPKQFADWHELNQSSGQIVNPQQTELIKKLYSQTLSRTYINQSGEIVMLSLAYGNNQSRELALHYPDVCYPAQGFKLNSSQNSDLQTSFGPIRAKQLSTELGNRKEPLTYWSTIGDHVVRGGTETRLGQLSYGFNGQIPDGLIFRVSSISKDTDMAYKLQAHFVDNLLTAVTPEQRKFLAGFNSKN